MDWTGLSECDQSELGLIVNGDTTDPEALNHLIQHEQEMLALQAQVAKHGPGYGQQPLRPQVIPGYDLRPSHCARVGHIGRSVYLPWGTIVRGQNVSYAHGHVHPIVAHPRF